MGPLGNRGRVQNHQGKPTHKSDPPGAARAGQGGVGNGTGWGTETGIKRQLDQKNQRRNIEEDGC